MSVPRVALWIAMLWVSVAMGCQGTEPELGSATDNYLAALEALKNGDQQAALAAFDASLADQPDAWTFYGRARLLADMGEAEKAKADCEAGLQLDPEHVQLQWLLGELKKPKERRFQGRHKEPPISK